MKSARANPGKETVLNRAGNRDIVINDVFILDYVNSVSVPERYGQDKPIDKDIYVWLATCLVLHSVNSDVAEIMFKNMLMI